VTNLNASEDARWQIKWKCGCGELSANFVYVTAETEIQNPRGRGTTNLVYKCKFCSRESQVEIVQKKWNANSPPGYNINDSGQFVRMVGFECRGMTPEEFHPKQAGWNCKSAQSPSGKTFEIGDEIADDWADYDDDARCSIGIYAFESKFERA